MAVTAKKNFIFLSVPRNIQQNEVQAWRADAALTTGVRKKAVNIRGGDNSLPQRAMTGVRGDGSAAPNHRMSHVTQRTPCVISSNKPACLRVGVRLRLFLCEYLLPKDNLHL